MPDGVSTNTVFDGHERRLQTVEADLRELTPSLARMEQTLTAMVSQLANLHAEIKMFGELAHKDQLAAILVDNRIKRLEDAEAVREQRRGALIKWGAGIAAAVIAAVIGVLLKLK